MAKNMNWDQHATRVAEDVAHTERQMGVGDGTGPVKTGRPKGSLKRRDGNTRLSLCMSKTDKQRLKDMSMDDGVNMADLVHTLIEKEYNRREKKANA